jgi:hypothetical protein
VVVFAFDLAGKILENVLYCDLIHAKHISLAVVDWFFEEVMPR